MATFLEIMLYSVLVLSGMGLLGVFMVFLGMWLAYDPEQSAGH